MRLGATPLAKHTDSRQPSCNLCTVGLTVGFAMAGAGTTNEHLGDNDVDDCA